MKPTKRAVVLLAGVATLAVAIPALGQQSPTSLLPPGFGQPARAPASPPPSQPGFDTPSDTDVQEVPSLPLNPTASAPAGDAGAGAALADAAAQSDADNAADAADAAAKAAAEALRKQDLPEFARRGTDHVGFLSPETTGVSVDAFGRTSGAFLRTLLARMDAPIASRWMSMLLRRVLTTNTMTPGGVDPSDWVAERALLLARMGEADAARLLVQSFDYDEATPRYYQAVMAAGMASADPGALCPVADSAEGALGGPDWPLARAICAGLSGENGTAGALVDRARSMAGANKGIDLLLAQRVVGAGTGARRAVDVQWSGVYDLSPWRFGLASAVGLAIPNDLLGSASLATQAWSARAPMLPLAGRLGAERVAATLGVMSSANLVDFVSAAAADPNAMDDTPAGRLRSAYAARDPADRMTALRALWADPNGERDLYASRILTARASARIVPDAGYESDASALIAAMLSAGLDTQAARWAGIVRAGSGTAADEAWALLAVGAPERVVDIADDRVANFGAGGRGSAKLRAQFLFAGLAALGRLPARDVESLSNTLDVPLGARNVWTRAIDAAAARGEPGTVAVLAAVGMQTTDWAQVSPVFLYHIVAALRSVGFDPEARMIAAEAISRT